MIVSEIDLMHFITKSIHRCSTPSLFITLRNFHSFRSYALLISRFKAIYPNFPINLQFMVFIASKATIMLSKINLPGTKTDWFGDIMLGKTVFNLLAKIFEISLKSIWPKRAECIHLENCILHFLSSESFEKHNVHFCSYFVFHCSQAIFNSFRARCSKRFLKKPLILKDNFFRCWCLIALTPCSLIRSFLEFSGNRCDIKLELKKINFSSNEAPSTKIPYNTIFIKY